MVTWMCGLTLHDRIRTDELMQRLGIESVTDVVRKGRLRWFGHVKLKDMDDWVSACKNVQVDGKRGRGRGRKKWLECVNADMKVQPVQPVQAWKNGR